MNSVGNSPIRMSSLEDACIPKISLTLYVNHTFLRLKKRLLMMVIIRSIELDLQLLSIKKRTFYLKLLYLLL